MHGLLRATPKILNKLEKQQSLFLFFKCISMPNEIIYRAAEIAYSLAWAEMEYIGSDKVIYLQNLPECDCYTSPKVWTKTWN